MSPISRNRRSPTARSASARSRPIATRPGIRLPRRYASDRSRVQMPHRIREKSRSDRASEVLPARFSASMPSNSRITSGRQCDFIWSTEQHGKQRGTIAIDVCAITHATNNRRDRFRKIDPARPRRTEDDAEARPRRIFAEAHATRGSSAAERSETKFDGSGGNPSASPKA